MVRTKRFLSIALVLITLFTTVFACSINVSADSNPKKCITYIYSGKNAGKTTYRTEYYTISKNERVTIQGYWNTEKLKNQTSVGIGGKKLRDYLRFDVHIIDKKTGKVVNYWYGLKSGSKFKVYSAVPNINSKNYTVKVTSYLSNYKTYKNSNLSGVATYLKYKLIY